MEAYAGGRQKTYQDNFDDLDLERPAPRADNGKELNDDNLRQRLITPGVQQKKSPGIKINLHSNNKKAAEQKLTPPVQVPLPGPSPFRSSFVPIGANPNVVVPPKVTAPPANPINEAEEQRLKNEKKKETVIEKSKLQQELHKLLTVEIFHGEGPGRYMYRGVLFKKANPNSKHMYICHVCKIQVLDNDIINHSNGKKHAANMEGVKIIDYKKEQEENRKEYANRKKQVEQELKPAAVEPGQPAPPGFEDTVRIIPLCQSMLDAFGDAPLIGLEYLVELLAAEDENCHVVCFLCDRRGESFMQNVRQNIISHMIGTTHRMNYLKRHFPRAHEALMKIQNDKFLKTELSRHVRSVVGSVEKAYGRLNPVLVDGNTFRNRSNEYRERVEKASHFSEAPGKTFEECIVVSKRAPSPDNDSPSSSRRGRSSDRRVRSRSPDHRNFGRSPDRRRSPINKRGPAPFKSWRNQSHSPEAGSSRVPTHRPRRDDQVQRPGRDNTPTLDEGSSPEVIGIHRGIKHQGKMPLSDALRDTTPVSNSDSPLSLSPPPNESPRRRRTTHTDLFGREVERRREYKHSRSPESRRSPNNRHGHRGRRVSRSPKRRRKSLSCSPISSKSGSRSPRAVSRTSDSSSRPLGIREKLDRFKRESEEIERDIKKKSRYYHTQPEKHPAYNGEWKLFWNRKQLEVKETGRDPSKYDYTPEWKVFWNERVEELYIHEYQERKRELKRKYNLTEEEPKKLSKVSRGHSSRDESASKVGSLSDMKDTWKALTGSDIKEEPKPPEKPEYHTVLGVLRQLSVLEPQLGSLGVTINRLLGKAISMEKTKKGSSEDLLLNIENTVLMETIKEKFRGQLMAGIVERFNVYATRNAITNISVVLDDAPPPIMKEEIAKAEEAPKPVVPAPSSVVKPAELKTITPSAHITQKAAGEAVAVPGVGNIDKAAIAIQIANALLAQGKTDVSNEELAQLVEAVVGMAQKQSAEASEQEKKVEEEKMAKMEELVASPNEVKPTDMSEDDLISCLKIFEFLPEHEKHSIIMQLQRLEETDPEKVKELRKYVNASTEIEKSPKSFDKLDSDDDDYLDSDVMKAANKNVEQQTKPKAADSKSVAEATASMMANLKDKMPARKLEPISTELPLPKIGSISAAQPLSLPPVDPLANPQASMHPMTTLPYNPYAEQPQYQYQQYGNPAYNSYYRNNNWPPPTNHVMPGYEFNPLSLPMPFAPVVPKEKKAKVGSKRTSHSTALIHLVGNKE